MAHGISAQGQSKFQKHALLVTSPMKSPTPKSNNSFNRH